VHEPLSVMDLLDVESASHSWTIKEALGAIVAAGRGVVVLLHRPESAQELRQRAIADAAPPPSKMDLRNYGIGAQILRIKAAACGSWPSCARCRAWRASTSK
jgi:3,4-dihydroxy 2-butanone 4-phosphate synthase/GTP cyclohydrolase II